jgi:hypothetical protein
MGVFRWGKMTRGGATPVLRQMQPLPCEKGKIFLRCSLALQRERRGFLRAFRIAESIFRRSMSLAKAEMGTGIHFFEKML